VASAPKEAGWLAALQDDRVGKALALVHAEPGGRWSAESLATRVGMSRSRFFERFTELVGEPPARYIARWRLHAAAEMLRREKMSVAQVAEHVGYGSEDALARLFKRHLGMSPSAYRRRLRKRDDERDTSRSALA
jgi:transcriptional regulator GlxA family with amidase domain